MPENNALNQRIAAAARLLDLALTADESVREQAARNAADAVRGVLDALLSVRASSAPTVDQQTIRHIIAPELERYWARQRKDPRP